MVLGYITETKLSHNASALFLFSFSYQTATCQGLIWPICVQSILCRKTKEFKRLLKRSTSDNVNKSVTFIFPQQLWLSHIFLSTNEWLVHLSLIGLNKSVLTETITLIQLWSSLLYLVESSFFFGFEYTLSKVWKKMLCVCLTFKGRPLCVLTLIYSFHTLHKTCPIWSCSQWDECVWNIKMLNYI